MRLPVMGMAALCAATFVLSAQPRPVLRAVVWQGLDGVIPMALLPAVSGEDSSVTRAGEALIARMLTILGDRGYLSASARVIAVEETPADSAIDVRITVDVNPGSPSVVQDVSFTGLRQTRPGAAQTLSGIDSGDVWTSVLGERGKRRLVLAQIFSSVTGPDLRLGSRGEARVRYAVVEKRSNQFDGMIGYLPPPANAGSGTVTGLVFIRFGNLFGTARQFDIRWFQERQGRQEISIRYREPAIAGARISGTGEFLQRRQDSTFVALRTSLVFDAEVGTNMLAGLSLSLASTTPTEGYGRTALAQSSSSLIGVRFTYDSRDRSDLPTEGVMYTTDVQTGRKSSTFNNASARNSMQRLSFDALGAFPLGARQSFYTELHGRDVRTGSPDEGDAFRIGGAATLRGYREAEFVGTRVVWGTVEYRLFLSGESYAGVFVDAGLIERPVLSPLLPARHSLTRTGYGFTSRFDTPVGAIGLSIALGEGDAIDEAKLHLRLVTAF